MRQIRLYQPHRQTLPFPSPVEEQSDIPQIYAFTDYAQLGLRFKGHRELNVLDRARVLHINRSCPSCGFADVEPLELNDAVFNRNNLPIPGTATLVGFHCNDCHSEWSGESA